MENEQNNLDQEAIDNVHALGEVLHKIHNRLLSEGYIINEDEIIDPEGKVVFWKSKIKK